MTETNFLPNHTTESAQGLLGNTEVALLPVGSTEQHGPALPLGTDYMTAEAFARSFDDHNDCVILPTIPVGVSEHHRQFDGTLWTSPDVFEDYVADIVRSIASHGVKKCVVVNGHGGNTDAINRAGQKLRREETAFAVGWNWWESYAESATSTGSGTGGHAGEAETSMVMSVREDLVREEKLQDAEEGASNTWGKNIHGANVGFDTIDFSDSGAVGKPTEASKEAGDALFESAREELVSLVEWVAEKEFKELMPQEHK